MFAITKYADMNISNGPPEEWKCYRLVPLQLPVTFTSPVARHTHRLYVSLRTVLQIRFRKLFNLFLFVALK
jgi:hypothetical protein